MADIFNEIDLLVRAKYPILYIVTWEEDRALADLKKIASEMLRDLYIWRESDQQLEGPNGKVQKIDPLEALNQFQKSDADLVYVFFDFHAFLADVQSRLIRKLRDVAFYLKYSKERKTIVIISPVLKIPTELEKDITVVDYPFPDVNQLDEVLDRVIKEAQENPTVKVNIDKRAREKILKACLGLTLSEAEHALQKAIEDDKKLSEKDLDLILNEKKQIIRKSGIMEYFSPDEAFNDIGGLEELKNWLSKRSDAFTDEARKFGLPAPRGIMLIGVPGCGKSLCAKAIAAEWDMPLLRLEIGSLFSSYVGSSEANIRKAITIAENISPTVLWLDEIEKGFSGAGSSESDGGTAGRVFGTFITWMQEKIKPVFVVATANDISKLPPELLRKGRFDEIFFVDLPDEAERAKIFEIHLLKRLGKSRFQEQLDQDLRLVELAQQTENFSGAEIEQSVISALYDAFARRKEESPLNLTPYLQDNLRNTVPLAVTMSATISSLRSWATIRARRASARQIPALSSSPRLLRNKLKRFRTPFAFDDGYIAESSEDFLLAAETRRGEIERHLYSERLEHWLRTNGFEPLTLEIRKIRQEATNKAFGVEQFLTFTAQYFSKSRSSR
ncbi:AAA family ATPase [candidate division KSB1 bacterium]|nr:AAA family ATPase [candidate division KSB1 bacterium]